MGDISTWCNNSYFTLREKAHDNVPINCIRVTNWLSKDFVEIVIITAGEEGFIKLWDPMCKNMI